MKKINFPNSIREFFTDSESDISGIDNEAISEYTLILKEMTEFPNIF